MKLHEQILHTLDEIDDDLLPDLTAAPRRTSVCRRVIRWTAAAAAAVLVFGGGGFLLLRRTAPSVMLPVKVYASEVLPLYLREGYAKLIPADDSAMTIGPLTGISLQPQIYTADSASDIDLPHNLIFADSELDVWRLFTTASGADNVLERNLRIDLFYANSFRDYGCVLWQIDRQTEPAMVSYLGIVPIADRAEAVQRLLDGQAVTTVPESELPEEGITEDRIDRRELVYLIPKNDDLIRIYECFCVRLTDSADGEPRWGLYYVPVTDEILN